MEYQHKEHSKYTPEQKGLKAYLIGRLALCDGYEELTRLEYLAELRELMEDMV